MRPGLLQCLSSGHRVGWQQHQHSLRRIADTAHESGTVVARLVHVADARFQGLGDVDLADVWYALTACADRHPHQFKALTDAVLNELIARRGRDGLTWLEQRFRAIRAADAREDV
jgi:hypothetical protein